MANFLSTVGGMLPAAYQGYNKGVDDEAARQVRTAQQEAEKTLIPLKQEAAKAQLQNQIDDAQTQTAVAPQKRKITVDQANATVDLLPGQIKIAQGDQKATLDKQLVGQVQAVTDGLKTENQALEYFSASAGEALARGDMGSLTRIFQHMVDAPIFPGLSGAPKPVSSTLVNAPAGATDIAGRPIQGPAVALKLADGSVQYTSPTGMVQAYQKRLETERQGRLKTLKAGDELVDPATGKLVYQADQKLPSGWIYDEQGSPIFMGGARGGAGGAGAGAGAGKGKPEKTAADIASGILSDALEKSGEKAANPQAYTLAQSYIDGIFQSNPGVPPRTAAAIAADAAADPTKISLQINPRDGSVNSVYVNPKFDGGKPYNLAANSGTPADMEKAVGGPEKMREAVSQMLAGQKDDATRQALVRAAKEPAYLAQLQDQIRKGSTPDALEANLSAFNNKVTLVKAYAAAPSKAAGKTPAGTLADRARVGGLNPPAGYTPDPNSPAGRSQAAQAKARAAAAERDASKQENVRLLSEQFQRDLGSMEPIDLARKYADLRMQLPTQDAAALRAAEAKIR